jgi:hypothetical protein
MTTKGKLPKYFARNVHVTQEIIDKSVQMHSLLCMGSTAIRDQIPGVSSINVTVERVRFNWNGWRLMFESPPELRDNLIKFDNDKTKVKPFMFRLQRPFIREVVYRPHAVPRGKTKKKRDWSAPKSRVCIRRGYHPKKGGATGHPETRPYKRAA